MDEELMLLKEKLHSVLNDEPINSEYVLYLSRELDKIILRVYLENKRSHKDELFT